MGREDPNTTESGLSLAHQRNAILRWWANIELGGVRIVVLSISSHEQAQQNPSLLFSYIVGSLILKDPFFQII